MEPSTAAQVDFSVIMAVYAGDTPVFVIEAFESLQRQTLPPSEILIVVDGPIGSELAGVMDTFSVCDSVSILRLPENRGPGAARDAAIRKAKHEIVAIMDADDICDPHRFERQLRVITEEQADLVGAWIEEFADHPGDLHSVREVPVESEAIYNYGKWRQPVNHVTAVFRRSAYLAAGGYAPFRYVEDYDLLVRMLVRGFVLRNIPEVLMYVRAGDRYMQRRQGMKHVREEFSLYGRMYRWKYINIFQLAGNGLLRIVARLFPSRAFHLLYKMFLRRDRSATVQ